MKSFLFSLVVDVSLQTRYFLEGYPLDFVFLFLILHFMILFPVSWVFFKLIKDRNLDSFLEKSIVEREEKSSHAEDYGFVLGFFGFFMGGWIGYLLRPSIGMFGMQIQPPFLAIIENIIDSITGNSNLNPFALISIEYMITGAILGAVVGWVVGKFIPER